MSKYRLPSNVSNTSTLGLLRSARDIWKSNKIGYRLLTDIYEKLVLYNYFVKGNFNYTVTITGN